MYGQQLRNPLKAGLGSLGWGLATSRVINLQIHRYDMRSRSSKMELKKTLERISSLQDHGSATSTYTPEPSIYIQSGIPERKFKKKANNAMTPSFNEKSKPSSPNNHEPPVAMATVNYSSRGSASNIHIYNKSGRFIGPADGLSLGSPRLCHARLPTA
jgi:hypothetical protein